MGRNHIYVRQLNPQSAEDIKLAQNAMVDSGNDFPRDAFSLPSTQIMIAEKSGAPILVQPFYRSLVMGSLAIAGEQLASDIASAMHQMMAAAYTETHRMGLLDILAFSNTPQTVRYALRHEFYKAGHPAYRREVR